MSFFIIMLISFSAFGDYIPKTMVGVNLIGYKIFQKEKDCKNFYNEDCLKIKKGYNKDFSKIIPEEIDDYQKPISTKNEIQTCLDKKDCKSKSKLKTCLDKKENVIINKLYTEIYCSKFLRYQKKLTGLNIIVEDITKKAKYESDKKLKESYDKLVTQELNDMKFGQKLYAMVKVLNKQKGLSKTQRDSLKTSLKNIKDAMFDGDLCDARSKTALIIPDGVLISQSDIDLILSKMDAYKKCI